MQYFSLMSIHFLLVEGILKNELLEREERDFILLIYNFNSTKGIQLLLMFRVLLGIIISLSVYLLRAKERKVPLLRKIILNKSLNLLLRV
jgi:hypothetical protein